MAGFGAVYTVRGEDEFIRRLGRSPNRIKKAFRKVSENAGKIMLNTVRKGMAGAGGGRVYGGIAAGAAGGYAAVRSGTLSKSMGYKVGAAGVDFGTSLNYGAFLETGTSRMAARPNVQLAGDASQPAVHREFTTLFFRELDKR